FRCVELSQFIPTFLLPSAESEPSSKAKTSVGLCDPDVQFKFTNVPGLPVPIPLGWTVQAWAIIFPFGERLSADHKVLGPSQPAAANRNEVRIASVIGLTISWLMLSGVSGSRIAGGNLSVMGMLSQPPGESSQTL